MITSNATLLVSSRPDRVGFFAIDRFDRLYQRFVTWCCGASGLYSLARLVFIGARFSVIDRGYLPVDDDARWSACK
jgi:hypothetical protein